MSVADVISPLAQELGSQPCRPKGADSLGGDFSLKTAKGIGTSVVMLLPMEFAKDAA
jgi:hypothetical protein